MNRPNEDRTENKNAFFEPNPTEKKGFFQMIQSKMNKEKIAEDILTIHEKQMIDLRFLAKMAYVIDNDQFCNQEFLTYMKLRHCLKENIKGYEGLYEPTKLVQIAIQAQDSFLKIDQAEHRYRGSKQQEVYEFVNERLVSIEEMTDSTNIFRAQLDNKVQEMLSQIKTEEGREALKAYAKELDRIADHELGLKLLSLFKTYNLNDYSILKKISDFVTSLKKANLLDFRGLVSLVMTHLDVFTQLGRIVGISEKKNVPETYAIILQYIALEYRHGMVRIKFEGLLEIMRKWYKPYMIVTNIRNQFSQEQYQIPKDFTEAIPGLKIYDKYKKSLTDNRTDYTYINFD